MRASTRLCQLYRLLSPRARHDAFCCYVTYRIVYRIVTTVSGYVSYRGKMNRCRPMYHQVLQGMLFLYQGNLTANLPTSPWFTAATLDLIAEWSRRSKRYNHSDRNDQMETGLNWHCCKQSSLPHQICLRQFWPFLVWKVRPSKIFCGNPAMVRPRSITETCSNVHWCLRSPYNKSNKFSHPTLLLRLEHP